MIVAAIPNLVLPLNGFANTLFRSTWIQVSVLGFPSGGYRVTLIGLLILGVLAFAVNGIVERLTGRKFGSTFASLLLVILGALLVGAFVLLPFDFAIEGIRIIASLLGAIVVAVFVVLIRQPKGSGSGSSH
jgi:drug/metabolite transporter (DMT)-like permease